MQNTSNTYKTKIVGEGRSFCPLILVNGKEYKKFTGFKKTASINYGDTITIGASVSSTINVTLCDIKDDEKFVDKPLIAKIGLQISDGNFEYIKLGSYVITEAIRDDTSVKITAVDNFYLTTVGFFTELKGAQKIKAILDEQCKKIGISFAGGADDVSIDVSKLDGLTIREVIQLLASYCGKNAVMNADGNLEFRWYKESGVEINASRFSDPLNLDDKDTFINKLECGIADKESIVLGTGIGISFNNSLIDEARLQVLYDRIKGFTYRACTLHLTMGQPELEVGDIITVVDKKGNRYKIPIMKLTVESDGGCWCEIEAVSKSESKSKFNVQGTLSTKVERTYQESIATKELVAQKVTAWEGEFETITTNFINVEKKITAAEAEIKTIKSDYVQTGTLDTKLALIEEALIGKATIKDLDAINANIQELTTKKANIDDLNALSIKVNELVAGSITTDYLESNYAKIDLANIKDGCITTAMIGEGVIGNVQIADGSITDAKIVGLTANKITAGKLDAAEIEVINLNCANLTVGTINGQQIAPGAIDLSKLDQALSGTITTTSEEVKQALIDAGLAQDTADDAQADATKALEDALKAYQEAQAAKLAAGSAQTSADGKNSVYYKPTPPTGTFKVGDTWYNTSQNNKMSYWDGVQWKEYKFGSEALENDAVTADKIAQDVNQKIADAFANAGIANDKIDNLEIGGRNLARDSKFQELKPKNAGEAADNFNYYRIAADLVLNEVYTVSAKVEITAGTFDKITVLPYPNGEMHHVKIENGKICCTFTKTIANTDGVLLYAGISGSTRGNGVIFREIMLTQGNLELDWNLAPEDIDSAITDVKTTADSAKQDASTAKTDASTAKQEASNAKTEASSAKTKAEQASKDATSAKTDASSAKTTADAAKQLADTAKTISDAAKKAAEDAAKDLTALDGKLTTVESTVTNNTSKLTTQGGKISALESVTTETNKQVTAVKGEVTTAKQNITTLQTNYSSLDSSLKGLTVTVGQHTSSINTVTKTVTDNKSNWDKAATALTTATDAKNKIDSLEIGARNLWINSSFNDGLNGYASIPNGGSISISTTKFNNNNVLVLSRTGSTASTGRCHIQGKAPTITNYFAGDEYILSAWVYVDKALDGLVTTNIMVRGSAGDIPQITIYPNTPVGKWIKFVSPVFKVSTNGTFNNCYVLMGGNGTIWVSQIMLTRGNKEPDWNPAPEDAVNKITAEIKTVTDKQATFQTTLDGITGRVSSVETTTTTVKNTVDANKTNWDKAVTALSTANTAKSTAESAASTATTAKTTADQAKTDALNAKSTASTAATTANTAKTTADTAKSTADSAKTTATTASTNANNALTTANDAKSKVDGLQIGSRNLIKSSLNINKGAGNWDVTFGTVTPNQADPFGTSYATKVKPTAANQYVLLSKNVAMKQLGHYSLSIWLKANKNWNLNLQLNASTATNPNNKVAVTTAWKRFTFTTNVVAFGSYDLVIGGWSSMTDQTVELYISHPMLVYGDKPMDHSPAPEDIDNRITTEIKTVTDKQSALELTVNQFKTTVSSTYATKTQLSTVDGKFASYSTTTQMNSAITAKANEINLAVSKTYATQASVSTVDGKFANYSTTTQMNSAITAKANEITLSVEKKVDKTSVIAAINLTSEAVKISAAKIDLSGYVTITNIGTAGKTVIDGGNVKTGTITATQIASNAITAVKIAGRTITADKLVAKTLTAASGVFADACIVTANIANLAVTSAKIANLAVGNAQIANAAITTAKIANLSITNALIANGAIDNAKIANLDAGKITTGTISADRIAAGSIVIGKLDSSTQSTITTAKNNAQSALNQLTINAQTKLNGVELLDQRFNADTTARPFDAGSYTVVPATEVSGGNASSSNLIKTVNAQYLYTPRIPVNAAYPFYWSMDVYNLTTNDGQIYVQICFYDKTGKEVSGNEAAVNILGGVTLSAANKWQTLEGWSAVPSETDIRRKAYYARVRYLPRYSGKTGTTYIRNIHFKQLGSNSTAQFNTIDSVIGAWCYNNDRTYINGGKLYTGTVTATQIAANAIVAGKIATNAVTAGTIVAGAISADKLAANAVVAGKIAANAVTTATIAAGAVNADKISSNAILAKHISAGVITGDKLVAATITGAKIAARTIAANNIVAGAITAAEIKSGTITATQIASGTITATQLASNSVTAVKIAAKAITADKLNVTSLSSITANIGAITSGSINIGGGKFVVNSSGALTATSANISGTITATSGSVGGWAVNSSSIYKSFTIDYGKMTQADIDNIQNHIMGKITLTAAQIAKYDTNGDGLITATDYVICRNIKETGVSTSSGTITISSSNPKNAINIKLTSGIFAGKSTSIGATGITSPKFSTDKVYISEYFIKVEGAGKSSIGLDVVDKARFGSTVSIDNSRGDDTGLSVTGNVRISSGGVISGVSNIADMKINDQWIGMYSDRSISSRKGWLGFNGTANFTLTNEIGESFFFQSNNGAYAGGGYLQIYSSKGSDGCYNYRTNATTHWFDKQVSAPSWITRSKEAYKANIVEYSQVKQSALSLVRSSNVYQFNLKEEMKEGIYHNHYGFVVERETPQEIIANGGDGIDTYSLASINWQATKELVNVVEKTKQELMLEIIGLKSEIEILKQRLQS